jgi:hypothetical protein
MDTLWPQILRGHTLKHTLLKTQIGELKQTNQQTSKQTNTRVLKPRCWCTRTRKATSFETAFQRHFLTSTRHDHSYHCKASELTNWTKSNTNTPAYEAAVEEGGTKSIAWLVGGQTEVRGLRGEQSGETCTAYTCLSNHVTTPRPLHCT